MLKNLQRLIDENKDASRNQQRLEQIRQTYIGYLDPVTLVSRSKLMLNRNNDTYYQTYLVPLGHLPQRGFRASEHLLRKAFEWFDKRVREPEASHWSPQLQAHAGNLRMFNVRQPFPLLLAARRAFSDEDFETLLRACVMISLRYNVIGSLPTNEQETGRVWQCYQRDIASFIHAQMQEHYWEEAGGYEVTISKGFTELRPSAYTALAVQEVLDFRVSPYDKSNMAKYLFGGFSRCLYSVQKFQSDTERKLAVILDREASRWFKPTKGQFQIFYRAGADHLEYQPDFVAETGDTVYMLEPKARNEMTEATVIAKRDVAATWCQHASDHAASYGGKTWKFLCQSRIRSSASHPK